MRKQIDELHEQEIRKEMQQEWANYQARRYEKEYEEQQKLNLKKQQEQELAYRRALLKEKMKEVQEEKLAEYQYKDLKFKEKQRRRQHL